MSNIRIAGCAAYVLSEECPCRVERRLRERDSRLMASIREECGQIIFPTWVTRQAPDFEGITKHAVRVWYVPGTAADQGKESLP
ncbi:hypothetical protein [Myxococcus landrumensis]|uniref:Lipoprotein n=1 Tax=Myxococcus landrumensis TaxID=2813577 RepID=A0ABX7N9F6_9BACT|nr:hypothetical protein [Myxococcus landrumus]QSQ14056.1 hypothetical protein JY572_38040 [Myxococcus landrumus]